MKIGQLRRCAAGLLSAVALFATQAPLVDAAVACKDGGTCKIGDIGPRGGVVFFAAPAPQWWGQYIEAFPNNVTMRGGFPWLTMDPVFSGPDAKARRIEAKLLGAGRSNSEAVNGPCSACVFVPSKDELDALYNFVATTTTALDSAFTIGANGEPWWTSSEASNTFAWYQLFNDGTQFTDANGIINGLAGNKVLTTSNMHKGSSFAAKPMRRAYVSAFAPRDVSLPPKPPRPVVPAGGRISVECSAGRSCQVGDIGPGGGVVFYDAGKTESWGRYLEAAPASCQTSGKVWRIAAPGELGTAQLPRIYKRWRIAATKRVESKRLGMGRDNTSRIVRQHAGLPQESIELTAAGYADSLVCGGKDDWFLPSKDELDTLYNVLAITDNDLTGNNSFGFTRGFYWTSSEYNNETAWTQLWVDGQQFDREKWLSGDKRKDGGFNPFHVRPIRAFG
jgi:hypothetical protein